MEEGKSDQILCSEEGVTTFRLNQISDLHFSAIVGRLNGLEDAPLRELADIFISELIWGVHHAPLYPSTFAADVALSLLRDLSKKIPNLDALIVTGDLATTGADADLVVARDYFSGAIPPNWNPGEGCPSLLEGDDVIVALPGNHDRYEGIALLPGGKRFEKHFGLSWDFERGSSYDLNSPTGASKVKVCTLFKDDSDVGLGIVLADLTLLDAHSAEGTWGWIGQGAALCVGDMVQATHTVRAEAKEAGVGAAVIWAIHYPPGFPGNDEKLKLIHDDVLVAAAEGAGVQLILAGHTHQPLRYVAGDHQSVNVICSGATTGMSADEHYSYAEIEIDLNIAGDIQDIRAAQWVWDAVELAFVNRGPFPQHPLVRSES